MQNGLCVILTVRDREATLWQEVVDLIESLAERMRDFTIVIASEGAYDEGYEVACELGLRFPQVKPCRVTSGNGPLDGLQVGLRRTQAQRFVVLEPNSANAAGELAQILCQRSNFDAKSIPAPALMRRLNKGFPVRKRLALWMAITERDCVTQTPGAVLLTRGQAKSLLGAGATVEKKSAAPIPTPAFLAESIGV